MVDRLNLMRGITHRRRWLLAAGLAVVTVCGAVWALWPAPPDPPRARQYLQFTACLLADGRGLTGPEAKPVWDGMQDASLTTRAKVQYLSVAGPQTVDNAVPFLASLVQGHCDLIFAAGAVPAGAVDKSAARFPAARFVVVAGGSEGRNVSKVDGPMETVRPAVKGIVTKAAQGKR